MAIGRESGGTSRPAAAEKTAFPFIQISPPSAVSSPARQRSVVVLPQPLGPSKVKKLFFGTAKLTSSMTRFTSPLS